MPKRTGFPPRDATEPKLKLRKVLRFPSTPSRERAPGDPFQHDRDLRRDLPARAGRFQPHGVPPEYARGTPTTSMKRAECTRCGRPTDPENLNYDHVCLDCQREMQPKDEELSLGKDILGRPVIECEYVDRWPLDEGLSVNGSMGLGGIAADGFEIQNQGVTKRRPGEGAKDNGGRSQSQEMDSYDQPQYEAREVKPGFFVYRPGEEEPPIEPDEREYHRPRHEPEKPEVSDTAMELYPDLFRGYKKKSGEKVWTALDAKDPRYGPSGQVPQLQRVRPPQSKDIEGYDFTLDNPRIIQMLGGEKKQEWPEELDLDLDEAMGIEKASEKEHEEHPWLTKKQAVRIAKDHEKEGKRG